MMKTGLVKIYRHFGSSQATRAMSCQVLPWYIVTLMYTDKVFIYTFSHHIFPYSNDILLWHIATLMYTHRIYLLCFSWYIPMISCYFNKYKQNTYTILISYFYDSPIIYSCLHIITDNITKYFYCIL